jgi:outer membrane usher protein FimD/PapC
MGFRLPMEWETSAGADLALASTKGGTLLPGSEQATVWGRITKVSVTPASQSQQDVTMRVDTLRGNGSLIASRSRSWILSSSLDMQTTRSISVDYDAADPRKASVAASQSLTLIHPWTGTSVSAGGNLSDFKGDFSGTLGLSQEILPNLNLSASVTDALSESQASNVSVNYRLSW